MEIITERLRKILLWGDDSKGKFRFHCFIVLLAALAIDHYTDQRAADLLGLPDGFWRNRFVALYFAPFCGVGFWIAYVLKLKRENASEQ